MLSTLAGAVDLAAFMEGAPASLATLLPTRGKHSHRESIAAAACDGSRVELVTGAAAVEAMGVEWRALAASSRRVGVFQTHAWAAAAARFHEARGAEVRVVTVRRNGRVEAALPLAIVRRARVRVAKLLGDPVIQYGDALIAADAPPQTLAAILSGVRSLPVDLMHVRRLRADAALAPAIGRAALIGEPIVAPYAELPPEQSVEDVLREAGGAKQRRERGRSRRRLAERGAVRFEVFRGPAAVAPLREAIAVKRSWLAARGLASAVLDDPDATAMLEDVACDPYEGDACVAMTLSVGGVAAAYEVGHVFGSRFHAYLGAVTETFAGASPGKVLMEEVLGWCRDNGVAVYDLLPSTDDYKRRWSNGSVAVSDAIVPFTAVGRLYADVWLKRAKPWLRGQAIRLPHGLRRAAMKAALGVSA